MTKKTNEQKVKNIGLDIIPPKEVCDDVNCPFHGNLKVHGSIVVGQITSAKAAKTAKITYVYRSYIPKYERYEKKYTNIKAHNPLCINAKEGDKVKIMETRPLSKTKSFVIIEKLEE